MASQEFLDQLGNSSSTSDEGDDDASTSSEDMNGMAISSKTSSPSRPLQTAGDDHMEVDSPKSKPKQRIKLTLRPSITSTDGSTGPGAVAAAAADDSEGTNGIKKEAAANGDNAKCPQVLAVKQEPNIRTGAEPTEDKPGQPLSDGAVKIMAGGEEKPKLKKKKVGDSKEGPAKAKKTEAKAKIKKEGGKVKKEGKAKVKAKVKIKVESGARSNGTAKLGLTASGLPKKKIKKKGLKLPLSMKRKLPVKSNPIASDAKAESAGSAAAVSARVVDSNEVVEEDAVAVATVVDSGPFAATSVAAASAKPATKAQPAEKKRQQAKPIRLPPMTSPGLLISHLAAGTYRSAVDAKTGFAKPETVFEQSMAMAGYTTEGRTKEPHRGSSVKRVVGDMFDSDVGFTLNFPKLVPKDLWEGSALKKGEKNGEETAATTSEMAPLLFLLKSLKRCIDKGEKEEGVIQGNGKDSHSRKRQRPWEFRKMIPVSLTIPYPEDFMEKRLKYVKEVEKRERAIVEYQEAQEKVETEREEKEIAQGKQEEGAEALKIENPVKIPPIPAPPPPPLLSELKGLDVELYEDKHPIYLPKGKQNFVDHLDQDTFHITEGRYFGLSTNAVADPHFVGANAPGVAGLPVSVGSGLATSSTSSGTTSKSESVLAVPPSAVTAATKSETITEKSPAKKDSIASKTAKKTASLPAVKSGSKSKFKLKHVGPTPTANASDLRKLMEEGGEMAEKTKQCIIRAAVHASRSGKHGQSFLAPDGKAYPDVSKAFAAHAGLKPCSRCKNNKQGAYHCRLRRKHKELDHDGSNSPAELAPLLLIPMEDLLIQPKG